MFSEIINTSNLPTLDLHGEICDIEVLKENRSVLEYKTSYFNDGMTLVKLNI